MMNIKASLRDWLNQLNKQKEDAQEGLNKYEYEFKLAQVKFNIANSVGESISHNNEKKEEFYQILVKEHEDVYKSFLASYDDTRKRIFREINYLDALIKRLEESIDEFE